MAIQADLSLCTFTRKPGSNLKRLLASIYKAADPVSVEVIVVDLSQGIVGTILEDFPDVMLYQSPGGENFATAQNRGLSLATGRYLALLEEDVVVTPDYFSETLTFLDDNPDVGIACPKISNAYGTPEPSRRVFFSPLSLLAAYTPFGDLPLGQRLIAQHIMAPSPHEQEMEIDWSCGGSHIVRREVFEEIGYLDEKLELPFSEQDFYLRAKQAGWHNMYWPKGEVIHANPSRYQLDLQKERSLWKIFQQSKRYFWKKWRHTLRQ